MVNTGIPHRGTGASKSHRIGSLPEDAAPLWGIQVFPTEVRARCPLKAKGKKLDNKKDAEITGKTKKARSQRHILAAVRPYSAGHNKVDS